MKVRYSYLPQQFEDVDAILNDIRKHLVDCQFTLGPEVAQFERSFAGLIGTQHSVGVGSGTDALKLPLKALGVGHGDEVITAANTFIATVGAIVELGARPVLVEATPYYTIDANQIEKAITKKTKAIMPVHFTGEPADMTPIMEIAKKYDLPVVEDACQSILAAIDGKQAGTWGVAAGFSLHPLKNLNVWGDAGVTVTSSDSMRDKLHLLRNHGMKNRDEIEIFGYNSRLDSIQAIVGNWIIKQTHQITEKRIQNGATYDAALMQLEGKIKLAPRRANAKRVFHLYMFETVDERDRDPLYKHLHEQGVDAKVHYPIPLPTQNALQSLGYKRGDFPETERQSRHVITVPVDQHLSEEQVQHVIASIKSFFA